MMGGVIACGRGRSYEKERDGYMQMGGRLPPVIPHDASLAGRGRPPRGYEIIREPSGTVLTPWLCVTATKPVQAAIPEQGTGQLDQPQIILVLLVVAHQDPPAL